jgi:AbrB family looped-hinge helix DNA binding protein
MAIVKTSSKCQIVIPKDIRTKIGLKPNQHVQIVAVGKKATIIPLPEDPINALCGIFKDGPSLTKALLRERREDKIREEERLA